MPSSIPLRANLSTAFLLVGGIAVTGALGACEGTDEPVVLSQSGATTSTGSGGSGGTPSGTGATGGGFNPTPDACSSYPGELICVDGVAVTCDDQGNTASEQDCDTDVCVPGTGCQLCVDGQFSCYGNELRSCSVGPPMQWQSVATCNPTAAERCNPTLGACEVMQPIGNGSANPTGTYYQYARFTMTNSVFLGGCDTDSYGNYIYVNRGAWYVDGSTLDVYAVELLDSDGDGDFEPNQHPDNPDDLGPIEERVLTHVGAYDVAALGMVHHSEVFVASDRVFLLGAPQSQNGEIFEYLFASGTTNTVVAAPSGGIEIAQMGFDEVSSVWYGSTESARRVYSYHQPTNAWVAEFAYPNLAGDHMDGMEVVTDPNTGTSYVYVSDMTSDYLGQYQRERGGTWTQVNLFEYQGTGDHVEGMGFGALNHFWITSGSPSGVDDVLYEIGGGDLSKYTEPYVPPR
ncbi:MAG: hypothetical protein JRI23_17660 [Deltaproteobacteria bacterium]|jgi:hypothetical protein|nr:hypothetical protein [Deltaproteobacteria bacterium]MBW2533658.1 hypothetical protein [Deltaproteobacteria bacterium]